MHECIIIVTAYLYIVCMIAKHAMPFHQRNSFQCVLVTYRSGESFVFFSYGDIEWKDSITGYAQAGFSTQNESDFYPLPHSGTEHVVDLNSTSNVDQPGLWVFRVDGTEVTSGGIIYEH